MPAIGAMTVASAIVFSSVAIWAVDGGDPGASGVDFLAPRAGAQPVDDFARGRDAIARALRARLRRHPACVTASSRCLREPECEARSDSKRSTSACGRRQLDLGGADVRLGGRRLRLGLADVFDASAGEQQPKLCVGLLALGPGARQRELGVGGVEARDQIAGVDAIAFGDAQLDTRPPTWAATWHVGRLDLAGHAHAIGRRFLRAPGRERDEAAAIDARNLRGPQSGLEGQRHGVGLVGLAAPPRRARTSGGPTPAGAARNRPATARACR